LRTTDVQPHEAMTRAGVGRVVARGAGIDYTRTVVGRAALAGARARGEGAHMAFASWRGTVGTINPTYRPGSLEEFIRLMPEGIGVIPMYVGIQEGTAAEFREALEIYEQRARELAAIGVDVVTPGGSPPFMVQGYQHEGELLAEWSRKYGVPVINSNRMQIDAMRALHMHRVVGVTYFHGEITDLFAQYFVDAGFEFLGMEGMEIPFHMVGQLSSREVYAHAKRAFRRHERVDGIYMLGSGWRVLDIVAMLEQDLEVPVLQATCARVWAIQQFFQVRERRPGYGRLLEELPAPAQ
jgi:maleate isomerase